MGVRIVLTATLLLTACKDIPVAPNMAEEESIARGKAAAQRLGCGACHQISGVWPKGTTGPSLTSFAARGMIGGKLSNRPEELTAFLLDPPATVPGTAMPRVAMSRQEAQDIASFLQRPDAD